ncbi:unnamed protein product [Meloidogyne enterolobii]|uniref:Uncharacterized protein n=1 Tax=Meloidogyne enterolobii TaxID=390850 RepID=A0ACB0YQU2_MELEN
MANNANEPPPCIDPQVSLSTKKKRKRHGPNLNRQQRIKKRKDKMSSNANGPPPSVDPQVSLKNENELLKKKNNELEIKLNNMQSKHENLKMVYYKFGRCIICTIQLNHENAYFLNNCGHKFHHYCITRWITEEKNQCPVCRVDATLDDIKQYFTEKPSDSSDDSDNELTQSTSNLVNVVNNNLNFVKFVQSINKWRKNTFLCCSNNCINTNKPIGNCIEGNGSGKVINDENVEYMNCLEEKGGKNGLGPLD